MKDLGAAKKILGIEIRVLLYDPLVSCRNR
jgi:hypothetical protein